jgi:chemotaxis protein histidine kinase CheA
MKCLNEKTGYFIFFVSLVILFSCIGICSNTGVFKKKNTNHQKSQLETLKSDIDWIRSTISEESLRNYIQGDEEKKKKKKEEEEKKKKKEEEEKKKKKEEKEEEEKKKKKEDEENKKKKKEEEEKRKKEEEEKRKKEKEEEEKRMKQKEEQEKIKKENERKYENPYEIIERLKKERQAKKELVAKCKDLKKSDKKYSTECEQKGFEKAMKDMKKYDEDDGVNEYQRFLDQLKNSLEKHSKKAKKISPQVVKKISTTPRQKLIKKSSSSPSRLNLSHNMRRSNIIGFQGMCSSNLLNSPFLKDKLPSQILDYKDLINKILTSAQKAIKLPEICLGDFDPAKFNSYNTLKTSVCADLPLPAGSQFGLLALSIPNLPCPSNTQVQLCLAFDDEGTVSFAINGGVLSCGLSATGVGTVLTPFTDFVGDIGISMSIKKKLSLPFELPVMKGDEIEIIPYDFTGHLSVTAGITVPFEKLGIGSSKLDEIIEMESRVGTMIDLGRSVNRVYDTVKEAFSKSPDPKQLSKNLIESYKVARKFGIQMSSTFKLKLDELTKGFLPDLEIEVTKASIAVFTESENGILPGLYLYMSRNMDYGIDSILQFIFDNFDSIFDALGIETPKMPSIDVELAIIVNTELIAIEVEAPEFAGITCWFKRKSNDASCNIGFDFFSLSKL